MKTEPASGVDGWASCRAVEPLPVGTSTGQALAAWGEPARRRTQDAGQECWDYTRYLDDLHWAIAMTTLTFESDRLVDTTEYRFL